MTHHEIPLPLVTDFNGLGALIENVCANDGLCLGLKGTLAAYSGCVHWHWRREREWGTLEITLWPARNRLWVSVHTNRQAEWTETTIYGWRAG